MREAGGQVRCVGGISIAQQLGRCGSEAQRSVGGGVVQEAEQVNCDQHRCKTRKCRLE